MTDQNKERLDSQIDALLEKMTLHEKIGQLNQQQGPKTPDEIEELKEQIRRGEIGSILLASGATAGNDRQGRINTELYELLQRIAVEESPNGIPILFGRDVIHGHRTVLPIPLAQAASWDFETVERCYSDVAEEAAAEGVHWSFAPMLDLCRDPRWGRIIEGAGEDPLMGCMMAKAVVHGFQGKSLSDKSLLVACAKHFVGYGASEGGRDYHRTEISDYSLYNYYLPAFRAAIKAGSETVMSSFNDINGQPVTSSRKYLTDILRGNLGFKGLVVSDYDAIEQLIRQGVAETPEECAAMALNAGVDIDMFDRFYLNELENAVNNGKVSVETVELAVKRVLRVKLAYGLFENPFRRLSSYDREQHIKHARKLAADSMVLLKNDGLVLPLSPNINVAVLGPFLYERRALLGSWTLDGKAEETRCFAEALGERAGFGKLWLGSGEKREKIPDEADVVVLALGESEKLTGEAHSLSNITLTSDQLELIRRAKESGKKTVGVLFCGRPLAMTGIADMMDAVLYAWHGGSCTADAVCDILFGDASPCGRLPVTLPRLATHIPLYYNVTSSGRPVNCYYNENPQCCYEDSIPTPFYPFGYRLSYTSFDISEIKVRQYRLSIEQLRNGESFEFSVTVKNTGNRQGTQTVQLYIRDTSASMMRPLRELKAFRKLSLNKGESKTATFFVSLDMLGYYIPNGEYVLEKGKFEIYIGENCLTENFVQIYVD
jgi:beta-glucosidase